MSPRRRVVPVLAAIAATGALAACAIPTSDPPPVPETTTIATPGPSGRATPSAGRTTGPTQAPVVRTDAALGPALLAPADLPAGFKVVPQVADDGSRVRSSNPKCREFVRLSNELVTPGTIASAQVTLSYTAPGMAPLLITEYLDAFGSAAKVEALLNEAVDPVAACPQVMMSLPGGASSAVSVRAVEPPQIGDHPTAFRLDFTSGRLAGLEITSITTGVGDTTLHLLFTGTSPADVRQVTIKAVSKARGALGLTDTVAS